MLKKYAVLLGIIISILLLVVATLYYPGGSQADKNSVGYSWRNNYISNLFGEKAVNGAENTGRYWAVGGMIFLSMSFALFFMQFSKRIPIKSAARIIQIFGVIGMLFTFLIVTSLHDIMVVLSSTMFLVSLFYITVFVLKSKLHVFKLLCVICLLVFYSTLYIYGSANFRTYLPVMQKITFVCTIIVIVGLAYFTKAEDFAHIKAGKKNKSEEAGSN